MCVCVCVCVRQGEWIKIKGGRNKKLESLKGVIVKNKLSILGRIDDESNIVKEIHRL